MNTKENQKRIDELHEAVKAHLEKIKKQEDAPAFTSPNLVISNFAHLMARLSELAEISSQRLERYTRWLIGLTVTLVAFALIDFLKMIFGFCH
jgi:hypothetical protein